MTAPTTTGVASMTGFARIEGADGSAAWVWEARSVNGRGLDIRVRAPGFVEGADRAVRQAAAERFKRGSVQVNLTVERIDSVQAVRVDTAMLEGLIDELARVRIPEGAPIEPARLDGLLQVKGVLATGDAASADEDPAAPLRDLGPLLDALRLARAEEGARLKTALEGTLDQIAELAGRAATLAERQPPAILAKYRDAMTRLMGDGAAGAEDRILQEAAALAVKADVSEELDRLAAHVEQARGLLAEGGPIGRRLDFLCQEFNREANTLGAKSTDLELTRVAMDLKAAIDALREQVQNVE